MVSRESYDEPRDVAAEKGQVLVDGPDGVSISFTPGAALETSDRLLAAGTTAHGQAIIAEQPSRYGHANRGKDETDRS